MPIKNPLTYREVDEDGLWRTPADDVAVRSSTYPKSDK